MVTIKANKRTVTGSNACKKLRREGKVPGNIYGAKKENIAILMSEKGLLPLLQERDKVVTVEMENESLEVIVKEIQRHPVTDRILHIDFLRVAPSQ